MTSVFISPPVSFPHVYLALSHSLVVSSWEKLKRCEEGNKSKSKNAFRGWRLLRQVSASQRIVKTPWQTLLWWLIEDWQAHESTREYRRAHKWRRRKETKREEERGVREWVREERRPLFRSLWAQAPWLSGRCEAVVRPDVNESWSTSSSSATTHPFQTQPPPLCYLSQTLSLLFPFAIHLYLTHFFPLTLPVPL